jgi:peptide/nickel transport system substrate-binding protein
MVNRSAHEPRGIDPRLSRRQFFQYSSLAAAAVAGSGVLAACGGDDGGGGGSGGTGGSGGGSQRTGGQLTHGATGGSSKDTLDAHVPTTAADIARCNNLYEPLFFFDNNYEVQPAIAESLEPSKDARSWNIKLRQGVVFHNGKPVTPDDVLATIRRVCDPKAPKNAGSLLSTVIDFDATKADGKNGVTLALSRPLAILDLLLAEYTFGMVPADYDPANPVGTGAFAYESFTPGKTSTFKKFADYWGDPAFVDSLVIQDFADDQAKVNALLAGQIQTVDNLPYNLIDSVKNQGGNVLEAETGAFVPFTMRVDVAPFSDVRVRQAMRLIVDRQQMIDQALSGFGTLGNDLYAPLDEAYIGDDVPQRQQDIEQAKSLLKSAGQEGLQVELFTGDDIGSAAPASASLFKEQAKAAGVDVSVVKKTPFYGDDYLSYPFAQDFWNTRKYIPQAYAASMPTSPYNETHWDDPKFKQLVQAAFSEVDDAKRTKLVQDAQKIEYESGGNIIWGFRRQVDGYGKNVQGVKPSKYLPLGNYKFQFVSV